MNCKEGDLAIVVGRVSKWMGRVVQVAQLEAATRRPFTGELGWATSPRTYDDDGIEVLFRDEWLRPIRDNPGEDETLSWARPPAEVAQLQAMLEGKE